MRREAFISGGEGSTHFIQKSPDTGNDGEFIVTVRRYWTSTPKAPVYSRPITCTSSKISTLPDGHKIIPGGIT
jgi:hypothetical protein